MWNGSTHPNPYVNLFVKGRIWVKWEDQQTVPAQLVDLILGELKKRLDVPKMREDDPSVGGTRGAALDASGRLVSGNDDSSRRRGDASRQGGALQKLSGICGRICGGSGSR